MSRSIPTDTMSNLMGCGSLDYSKGIKKKKEGKPVLTIGWMYFKDKVDIEVVKKVVKENMIDKIFRYRAKACYHEDGKVYFDEVDEIDMDYHFQSVGTFKDEAKWRSFLEKTVDQGMDYEKPLWKMLIIDELPCGRSAVATLSDHTMGDGASFVSALLSNCKGDKTNPVFTNATSGVEKTKPRRLTGYEMVYAFFKGIYDPLIKEGAANDMDTALKQPRENFPQKWTWAMGDSLELQKFKDIKNRVGCTVNDVVMAVTSLAIREFYKSIDEPIMKTNKDIHATYASNARPRNVNYLSDKWFGNHIVVAVTTYFLHKTRVNTLMAFRDESRLKKAGPDTAVRNLILGLLTKLPRDVVSDLAVENQCKFSIMVSNVLFSLGELELYGQKIDDVEFLALSPLGTYIGVKTYMDKISYQVVLSKDLNIDPAKLLPFFEKELKCLHKEVMTMDVKDLQKLDKPVTASPIVILSFLMILFAIIYCLF